jgi:hypothetical protein
MIYRFPAYLFFLRFVNYLSGYMAHDIVLLVSRGPIIKSGFLVGVIGVNAHEYIALKSRIVIGAATLDLRLLHT